MIQQSFTLEQARAVLPQLRQMLIDANSDLDTYLESVQAAQLNYQNVEAALDSQSTTGQDHSELRQKREQFQTAINDLQREQKAFVHRLGFWVDQLSSLGVIIRNLREGLVDFPAEREGFTYFLCWKLDEEDITHWHLTADGFIGRKPLITLSEYY